MLLYSHDRDAHCELFSVANMQGLSAAYGNVDSHANARSTRSQKPPA